MADAISAEVVGQKCSLPLGWHRATFDDFQTGIFRTAVIQSGQNLVISDGGLKRRPGESERDSLPAGAVGFKCLAPRIPDNSPRVDLPAAEDVKLHCLRSESPRAAAEQAFGAPRRFNVTMNVNALVEIEPAIRPPAEGVNDVMRVFRSESRQNDAA